MKKRTVTRKSLDELRKVMPVLTEQEQRECEGRAYYYDDTSGNYLGKLGTSNEIRIVNSSTFNSLKGCNDDSELFGSSRSLDSSSLSIKQNVMRAMARNVGYTGNVYMSDKDVSNNGSHSIDSGIGVNRNSTLFESGNYYDFLLLMCHEKNHSETMGDLGTAKSEYEAYSAMVSRPEFQYASSSYKAHILERQQYYKTEMEKEK